ncbi:MAG: hypothetical protein LBP35_06740 [Candidatus Ancillula trichonymphae]|nr:hypothetical protein [Candidatus Ancillula trichonymphae]
MSCLGALKIGQLGQPTLADGESVVDFRNDVSQYGFDIGTLGKDDLRSSRTSSAGNPPFTW